MNKSIVLTVCEDLGITPEEFFGPQRQKRLTHARCLAISRMLEAGFSLAGIAAAIRRNYSTVQYWVHASYREKRVEYFAKYHAAHPIPRLRKLQQDKRKHLVEVYIAHGFEAAKPIAASYGINPATISHYARAIGFKGKSGRPRRLALAEARA